MACFRTNERGMGKEGRENPIVSLVGGKVQAYPLFQYRTSDMVETECGWLP